jgi:hypothetical protein
VRFENEHSCPRRKWPQPRLETARLAETLRLAIRLAAHLRPASLTCWRSKRVHIDSSAASSSSTAASPPLRSLLPAAP